MKNQMFNSGDIGVINTKAKLGLPDATGKIVAIKQYVSHPSNYDYYVETEDGEILKVKESELNKLTPDEIYLHLSMKKHKKAVYHPTNEVVKVIGADYLHKQIEVQFDDGAMQVVGLERLVPYEGDEETVSKFKVGDIVKIRSQDRWNEKTGHVLAVLNDEGYTVKIGNAKLLFAESELEVIECNDNSKLGKFGEIALEIGNFTDSKNKQYGSSVDATLEMTKVLMERYTYDEDNYLIPKSLLKHLLLQVRMMDKQNRIFNNPSGEGDSESPYRDLAGYSLIGVDMVEGK